MAKFKISDIVSATQGQLLHGRLTSTVFNVTTDSRKVKKGSLFIAIIGEKHDAHNFTPEVIKRGAAGIVVSKKIGACPGTVAVIKVADTTRALGDIAALHRSRFTIPIVAITGSAGKTTTKEMIAALLKSKYRVLKNIGTENNQFGVPLTLLRLNPSDEIAVLEVGTNRPGDIPWLASIVRPTVAVMTNVGESHLELLKSPADVFKEKFHLVKRLGKGGSAIVNQDDTFLRRVKNLCKNNVITYGIRSKAKIQARSLTFKGTQTEFSITGAGKIILPGTATANIYNALAAIACARLFKVSFKDIKKTFKKFSLKSGRQTYIKAGSVGIINDSYNANPVSFRSALESIQHRQTPGRKILVCGDMLELGQQSKRLHGEIGKRAAEAGLGAVISFGKFSRFIGIEAKKKDPALDIFHSAKAEDVEARIKKTLRPADIVLVKGSRGMHTERFVEFIKNNF